MKRISSTLVWAVATAAITALPASAQSAKDLFCRGTYEFDEGTLDYRWGFRMGGHEFEKECP